MLCVASTATARLKVATGIAVAAARSPFETAMIAMDMDRISQGRFILGLGTGVSSVNVGSYGVPDYKLITHMRDTVAAIRHVIGNTHKRSEEHTSELQSLMRISYAVFCLKKKKQNNQDPLHQD